MNLKFKWIGGATWILQIDGIKIACDPVMCPKGTIQDYRYFKSKRLNDPIFDKSDFENIYLWLLTHNHEDHIDKYGIEMIEPSATIISHRSVKPLLSDDKYKNQSYLGWDEESISTFDNITIKVKAVPAIHAKRTIFSSQIGNGNGYLFSINKNGQEYCIYITGDSVYSPKIKKHFPDQGIDLLITNAGSAMIGKSLLSKIIGRVTNNIEDIKTMNKTLTPKTLIPVHWGTFSHYVELIEKDTFSAYENIKVVELGETINISTII